MEMRITCSSQLDSIHPSLSASLLPISPLHREGRAFPALQEQRVAQYKQLRLHFRLPVGQTEELDRCHLCFDIMRAVSGGRQRSLHSTFIFNFYTPLYSQLHCPTTAPLRPLHAYNCCSLKFNTAPCPTTPTPPTPETTPLRPLLLTHTTTIIIILDDSASSLISPPPPLNAH